VTGFTADYVDQIATNLRDRYWNGFPVLKELVRNADDAGAKALALGFRAGHGPSANHMLLKDLASLVGAHLNWSAFNENRGELFVWEALGPALPRVLGRSTTKPLPSWLSR